jgi:hypothetical protein
VSRVPRFLAAAAVAGIAAPVCAQGPVASIAAALERGDEQGLIRLTSGAIYSKLSVEARSGEIVRMAPADLIALTRGCSVADPPIEAGASPSARGSVGFRCLGRPVEGNRCEDIGYGLLILPLAGYSRVEVWENNNWSSARCGMPRPPAPPAPPRLPDRKGE